LTIWYAGIFAASSILALTLVYASVVAVVQDRTDGDLKEDIEEFASLMQSGGLERVKAEITADTEGAGATQTFFRLWAPPRMNTDGRELMATDLSSWPGLGNPREVLAKVDSADEPILATLALPRRAHKARIVYGTIAPGLVLEIGESLEEDEEFIAALLREFLITLGGSKAEAEAMAATTTEECDRLLEMINTTLDIAEAESGAAKLKLTDIDLVELVGDALELFQAIAEDQQITITADLPDHCRIHGDRQRLQRVVANLLDNGLKYMPAVGRVTIKLVTEGERVTLSIEDTGIGISADESARIFERFYLAGIAPFSWVSAPLCGMTHAGSSRGIEQDTVVRETLEGPARREVSGRGDQAANYLLITLGSRSPSEARINGLGEGRSLYMTILSGG